MAKVLNILFFLFLGFSCTQEKVPSSPFLDEDLTFLLGKWEWEKSIGQINFVSEFGGYYEHIIASETGKNVQLYFKEEGEFQIIENSVIKEYKIEDYRISTIENNTVVKFLVDNEVLIFIFNNMTGQLCTVKTFFNLNNHTCDLNHQILNNVFKKI